MTIPWQEMKQMIATKLREPGMTQIAGKLDIPRFLDADLDDIMFVCAQELHREVRDSEVHALGAASHTVITSASGSAVIPKDCVKMLAVTIDSAPAKRAKTISDFYLKKRASATQSIYVFISDFAGVGVLKYTGTNLRAVAVIEPALSVFTSDAPTLPPGYSEQLIARTLERITFITTG